MQPEDTRQNSPEIMRTGQIPPHGTQTREAIADYILTGTNLLPATQTTHRYERENHKLMDGHAQLRRPPDGTMLILSRTHGEEEL